MERKKGRREKLFYFFQLFCPNSFSSGKAEEKGREKHFTTSSRTSKLNAGKESVGLMKLLRLTFSSFFSYTLAGSTFSCFHIPFSLVAKEGIYLFFYREQGKSSGRNYFPWRKIKWSESFAVEKWLRDYYKKMHSRNRKSWTILLQNDLE